jgi:hypothetical protein
MRFKVDLQYVCETQMPPRMANFIDDHAHVKVFKNTKFKVTRSKILVPLERS